MFGCTGNSYWKMPCSDLHGMTRDEPCSCSISCGRINSVHRINCGNLELLDCVWKHCSSCRMWNTTVLEEDWSISPWISSLSSSLEIILFTELLYFVWMYTGSCCGFDHMFSLLKRCKYSLYSDTMLNYWSTNHCWNSIRMYILMLDTRNEEQTNDVRMYIEEYLF